MSKFKIGDRVRLLSDAKAQARPERITNPAFGVRGEIGTISKAHNGGWYVAGVGRWSEGWFSEDQLEHVDAKPVPKIQAAHDAIDRLVTELERKANEHVHALDALRAEVESLRTQNEHLRHLVEESRKVHEMNAREVDRNPDKVVRTMITGLVALAEDKDGHRRHAVKHARGYVLYDEDDRIVASEATEEVALGWCQFGWPYGVKPEVEAKPVREVVRGSWGRRPALLEPGYGSDADNPRCRHAVLHGEVSVGGTWVAYNKYSHGERTGLTESEAIAWVLDGVLPTR